MVFCLVAGLYEPPEGEWQSISGRTHGYFEEQSDFKFCSRGLTDWAAIHEGSLEQISCMRKRGWVWHEFDDGNSGPANVGRFMFLFIAFPILAIFFGAIVITRGRYRRLVLYALGVTVIVVVCYMMTPFFVGALKGVV
jgi:hypothetical protein